MKCALISLVNYPQRRVYFGGLKVSPFRAVMHRAAHPLTAHFLRDTKQEPHPGKEKSLRSLPLLWTLSMFKHRWLSHLERVWLKLNTATKALNTSYAETQGPFFTRKIKAVFTSIVLCPDVKLKPKWMKQPYFSYGNLDGEHCNKLMCKQYKYVLVAY